MKGTRKAKDFVLLEGRGGNELIHTWCRSRRSFDFGRLRLPSLKMTVQGYEITCASITSASIPSVSIPCANNTSLCEAHICFLVMTRDQGRFARSSSVPWPKLIFMVLIS